MAGVFKTVTFMVLVLAVVVFAEDHDVGGDSEWSRPTEAAFYTNWVVGKTFHVGDELEFEFAAGRHDVALVTKEAFEDCEREKPIAIFRDPPVKVPLNTTGPHYFICTIGDHCRFGQKLLVNVVAAGATGGSGGAGGGAAPGAGGATPTTPAGTTTTPAGNAASSSLSTASTFLVAIVSAFVALF